MKHSVTNYMKTFYSNTNGYRPNVMDNGTYSSVETLGIKDKSTRVAYLKQLNPSRTLEMLKTRAPQHSA